MDCETVRYRIEADPAHLDKDCAEHIEGRAAYTAYSDRVRNIEWLIHEALRFDVAAMKRHAARKSDGSLDYRPTSDGVVGCCSHARRRRSALVWSQRRPRRWH